MEPEEAARVESRASRPRRSHYQLDDGGRDIEVPKEQVDELRLDSRRRACRPRAASASRSSTAPRSAQTEFLEQVNYRRALEGEIARTIATHRRSGERARAHRDGQGLAVRSREQPAKASVVLKLSSNRPLAPTHRRRHRQPGRRQRRRAAARGGRDPRQLRPAAGARRATTSDEPLGAAAIERQQRLERELATRVVALLEPVVGAERVRVNVALRLNIKTQEETEERCDPDHASSAAARCTLDGAARPAPPAASPARAATCRPGRAGPGRPRR